MGKKKHSISGNPFDLAADIANSGAKGPNKLAGEQSLGTRGSNLSKKDVKGAFTLKHTFKPLNQRPNKDNSEESLQNERIDNLYPVITG